MPNDTLNTQGLFRAAAQLIERALIQLDMQYSNCPGCGREQYRDLRQARIYERFTNTPVKLRTAADILDGRGDDGALG